MGPVEKYWGWMIWEYHYWEYVTIRKIWDPIPEISTGGLATLKTQTSIEAIILASLVETSQLSGLEARLSNVSAFGFGLLVSYRRKATGEPRLHQPTQSRATGFRSTPLSQLSEFFFARD